MGVGRNGEPGPNYYARHGARLRAKYALIGEGARGSLAKQLDRQASASQKGREPQKFGIGLKELWQVEPGEAPARAWCSTPSAGRSDE